MIKHKKLVFFTAAQVVFIAVVLVIAQMHFEIYMKQKDTTSHKYGLTYNVYATITFRDRTGVHYYYSGLDPLTNLGLNLTCTKLTGSTNGLSPYNLTTYNQNSTFVSLGNYTTAMSGTTTQLNGEWIRVSGTIHAQVYNGWNITGVFSATSNQYIAGSNSSNCMGVEYGGSGFGQDLFGYTTFSLVTGIDSSFVITAEIQIQLTTT